MANVNQDFADYGIIDPQDVQDAIYAQQDKEAASGGGMMARTDAINRRGMESVFGNPTVDHAKYMQAEMQNAFKEVDAKLPDDADPTTRGMATSTAVMRHFANLPNGDGMPIALKAADQAIKYQTALSEQKKLKVETDESVSRTQKNKIAAADAQMEDRYIPVKVGKDDLGFPTYTTLGDEIPMWNDNGEQNPEFPQRYKQAVEDANKQLTPEDKGAVIKMMRASDLETNKNALAGVTMQARLQIAQDKNETQTKVAEIRAQAAADRAAQKGQKTDRFAMRILSSGVDAAQTISNISTMNFGTTRGYFTGVTPGKTLTDIAGENLRNGLTSEDSQMYNVAITGLAKNLSMLSMQGGLAGGESLSKRIEQQIQVRPGDTHHTILQKMAEVRQIVDTNTKLYMADPNIPQDIKDEMQKAIDQLHDAVPYTVKDVIAYAKESNKDKKLSFSQYATKHNVSGSNIPDGASPEHARAIQDNPRTPTDNSMPSGEKLTQYAKAHFNGDENEARKYLALKGYK
jgi:hypothetical protein